MTLVDTSVWIDHFRSGNKRLSALLEAGEVLTHELVIGELSLGVFRSGEQTFAFLDSLPKATAATDLDLRGWIESRKLWGRGIGWIDAHLAASALLTPCALWTLDARLRRMAAGLGIVGQPFRLRPGFQPGQSLRGMNASRGLKARPTVSYFQP